MTHDADKRIRDRAYHIWEAEGRPHGREHEFWERAMKEEHAAAAPPPAKEAAPKKAAPKAKAAAPADPAPAAPKARRKSAKDAG